MTLRIRGFLIKRVMIDQGSKAEIMYPNLYKCLGLKVENLKKYDTPLVGFDGKIMMLEGSIMLLVVIEGKKGDGEFYSSECILTVHSNLGMTMDPCYGSCIVYTACEGEIPH